jgi:hypothetical protein
MAKKIMPQITEVSKSVLTIIAVLSIVIALGKPHAENFVKKVYNEDGKHLNERLDKIESKIARIEKHTFILLQSMSTEDIEKANKRWETYHGEK